MQRSGELPRYPKNLVKPTIVAGINALGRGQDRESLTNFIMTIAQTVGPEGMLKHVNIEEFVKRLAAAQGIDVLNLVKSMDQQQQDMQQNMEMQKEMEMTKQTGQIASAPINDPTKNPALAAELEQEQPPM